MVIGKRIIQYRAKHKLSQLDMAEKLGVSRELNRVAANKRLRSNR